MAAITISQRGAEAYAFWLDKAVVCEGISATDFAECLIEATNALGWLGPGEMDFDEALVRVLHQIIERHGVRLPRIDSR